jgi:hypothetical protein
MQALRPLLAAAALVAVVLAGCTTPPPVTTPPPEPPVPEPYALDCSWGDWNQTCVAFASPNDSLAKAEIDIAVNPTNPLNVFVASKDRDPLASKRADNGEPCVWAVGQVTFDGGKTWNTTYVGGKLDERQPGDHLWGWECITDPILAFEPDGTLHYSLQVYRMRPGGVASPDPTGLIVPDGGNMYHAVSHDGGRTFPKEEIIPMHVGDSGLLLFHDYMRMGVNPQTGTVFTIWNQLTGFATSQPVLVAVESGAATARPPVYFPQTVSPLGLGESGVVGANDGTVYAWLSGFNSGGNAVIAVSTDDGLTFSEPRRVWGFTPMGDLEGAEYRTGTAVELAVDTSGGERDGCLYAVWGGQEDDTEGPSDVYVRTSCDKGETWTEPILVNTQGRDDGQWMPRVSVDGNGTVHVVYYTRHHDPAHFLMDAEHAYSTDGGRNWTQQRITSVSFDGNLGLHQEGFPFIGDYIGIASAGAHTYMGFSVTQTGRAEIGVAHVAGPATAT